MAPTLVDLVRKQFGSAVLGSHAHRGDQTVLVQRDKVLDIMSYLKNDPAMAFDVLADVTAVDYSTYPEGARAAVSPVDANHPSGLTSDTLPRYEVVYHLLSMSKQHRLRVKVALAEGDEHIPSMCGLWIAANWGEREAFDMMGIQFDNHPDLRRILTYPEFEGHPLRKDFPLRGYQPLVAQPTLADYKDNETFR